MAQLVGCCITGGYWGGGVPRALPALPLFCLDFLLLRATSVRWQVTLLYAKNTRSKWGRGRSHIQSH